MRMQSAETRRHCACARAYGVVEQREVAIDCRLRAGLVHPVDMLEL